MFDFDGTLVDGDAGVLFARRLTGRTYLDALTQNPVKSLFDLTRLNLGTARRLYTGLSAQLEYHLDRISRHEVIERAYTGFQGLEADWVTDQMRAYAREKLPKHLRRDVVDRMRSHLDEGDHVVVVSTGIHDLIWPLRDVLGLDFEVVACRLRERDGHLTGTVEGPMDGQEKLTRVIAIAKRRGHDLEEAFAYSDHEDDAVILDMVGNPVVVHPTREMREIADERDWPVLYDR